MCKKFLIPLLVSILIPCGNSLFAVDTQGMQRGNRIMDPAPIGGKAAVAVSPDLPVNIAKTAVLIMDYQNDIVSMFPENERASLLDRASTILRESRQAHIPVIYIVVRFRDGYPEINPRNKLFSSLKESKRLREGTAGAEIHTTVTPQPGDIVVTKRRVGAFSTTDLDTILHANNINTLAVFGLSTSGVVLSTVRWAADMDYSLIVISDACADRDAEVNRVLMDKVFPWQATVVTTQEFLTTIQGKNTGR